MKLFYSINKTVLIFALSILAFAGCKKDDVNNGSNANPPDLTTKVNAASISGFVTNENNQPILNAQVQIGSSTITTDKYGFFEAKNVDVIKTAATVIVTKVGYFKGIKTFAAEQGKSAFFRIKLIPKATIGNINGSTGGAVTLTNGMSVTFPANSIVNATTNVAYAGTVNVSAYWINPTSNDLPLEMPGDLRGINAEGNLQLLTTYGMVAVEVTGTGGELLQIATGKKASLSLPIPASILANAPATIPLWYFDEAKGLWKQEGTATKTGSNYVGDVSHFSFWNCDYPENFVQLNATIVNINNQPVQNALIKISQIGNIINHRYGYTDANGYVSGAVPSNSQLLFEVFANNNCINPNHSQNITTTNANISMGTIAINNTTSIANITGSVINCNGQPVTNGHVLLYQGSQYVRYNLTNTGNYSINLLRCGNQSTNVILVGEDIATQQQSLPISYTINTGSNNIPPIQACGLSNQEFLYYTRNDTLYSYAVPVDSIYHFSTGNILEFTIGAKRIPFNGTRVILQFVNQNISVGSQQPLTHFSSPQNTGFSFSSTIYVNITEYGAVGGFISGNFVGILYDPAPTSNAPINTQCGFRIRRNF